MFQWPLVILLTSVLVSGLAEEDSLIRGVVVKVEEYVQVIEEYQSETEALKAAITTLNQTNQEQAEAIALQAAEIEQLKASTGLNQTNQQQAESGTITVEPAEMEKLRADIEHLNNTRGAGETILTFAQAGQQLGTTKNKPCLETFPAKAKTARTFSSFLTAVAFHAVLIESPTLDDSVDQTVPFGLLLTNEGDGWVHQS